MSGERPSVTALKRQILETKRYIEGDEKAIEREVQNKKHSDEQIDRLEGNILRAREDVADYEAAIAVLEDLL